MARIDRTTLLAAIRDCITVVEPGDVLAVRVSDDLTDEYVAEMADYAGHVTREHGISVIFVRGDEFARLKAGTGNETFKALQEEIRCRGGSGPASVQAAPGGAL